MGAVITSKSKVVKDFIAKFQYRYVVDFRELINDPLFEALKNCTRLDLSDLDYQPFATAFIMRIAVLSDSIKELSLDFTNLDKKKLFITKLVAGMPSLKVLEGIVIHKENVQFDKKVLVEIAKSNSIIQIIPNTEFNRANYDDESKIYKDMISKNTDFLVERICELIMKDQPPNPDIMYEMQHADSESLQSYLRKACSLNEVIAETLGFEFANNAAALQDYKNNGLQNDMSKAQKSSKKFDKMHTIQELPQEKYSGKYVMHLSKLHGIMKTIFSPFKLCYSQPKLDFQNSEYESKVSGDNNHLPDYIEFETLV